MRLVDPEPIASLRTGPPSVDSTVSNIATRRTGFLLPPPPLLGLRKLRLRKRLVRSGIFDIGIAAIAVGIRVIRFQADY